LYQGEIPFYGFNDEEIFASIISKNDGWSPKWKEGMCDITKNFILKCLDTSPLNRMDKISYINDPYINLSHTPIEMLSLNKVLLSNLTKVYEIYSHEQFIEALLTYYSQKINILKKVNKIKLNLKEIDPKRVVFVPLENLLRAFQTFYSDEYTYLILFDLLIKEYLNKRKEELKAEMEIDLQMFFTVFTDMFSLLTEKKLLRSIILLSFVSLLHII
jgi:serine/threonine protein kinase